MEYTQIPGIDQKVTRIGLGTWAIGGWMWGGTDEANSIEAVHTALDKGVNLIDTAPVYGFGVSEEIVGKALKKYGKRDKIILTTKTGLSWKNPQEVYRDTRKATVFKEIEASLRRLQVDYIDLYLIHWPDTLTPASETAEAMQSLLKQGKVRAIGVCNYSVEQMEAFQKSGPLHVMQAPFNLYEDEIEKKELAYCLKKKIATMGYSSICRGLLSGKMKKDTTFKGDDLRKSDPKFKEPHYSEYLNCNQRLQEWVRKKYNKSLLDLALRWSLDKGINIALWGARKPDQMKGIDTVWGWKLIPADFAEIDKIKKETLVTPLAPVVMEPPQRN